MRYSGEGTQASPYIPEDLTGFLYCIAQPASYVKLESDIDAAADSGYEGILYEPVTFSCKECRADSLKKIIGVTVMADNMLVMPASETVRSVRNIGFLDWSFKQVSAPSNEKGYLIFANKNTVFSGCPFSVQDVGKCRGLGWCSTGEGSPQFSDCSFVIEHIGESQANSDIFHNIVSLNRCSLILDGGNLNIGSNFLNNNAYSLFRQVGILIRDTILTSGSSASTVRPFSGNASSCYNYLAFESNCTSNIQAAGVKLSNRTSGMTLYVTNNLENLSVDSGAALCYDLTEAQIKDADYLAGIGFFP